MGALKYPSVVTRTGIILTPNRLNYGTDEIMNILENACRESFAENKLNIIDITFLNNDDNTATKDNTIAKLSLPIFPGYYQLEKQTYTSIQRINVETELLQEYLNTYSFLQHVGYNNSEEAYKKYGAFNKLPYLLQEYILSPTKENFNAVNEYTNNMKKIAGVEFPAEMPVIEKYINVCTSEAKKVLDMYRKFTKSCEDKNIVNQEEINQKTDSNQSKRLLHSIYYDILSSHYWTVENLEEKNQKALEQFKLYKDAARYDSINQNYIERTSIQSADQIEYQMMEICEMLLNKNFGGGGFGE